MVSVLSIFVLSLLLTGLLLLLVLPVDFRTAFLNPKTYGEQLLLRSVGLVAIAALIAEIVVGRGPDNGINGISPCLLFGAYGSVVLYLRAAYFLWNRRTNKGELNETGLLK